MGRLGSDGRMHARLSASESERWINCPGSVNKIEALPDSLKRRSSRYADEGTAAHKLGENCLIDGTDAREHLGETVWISDDKGFTVDEDMADAVQVYLDLARALMEEFPDADFSMEKQFVLDWIHRDCFGTNDFTAAALFDKLVIVDYKHGKGVPVDVENNTQLMYYALGAAKEFDFNFDEVVLIIVQPRCPHRGGGVRRWAMTAAELEEWGEEVLRPAALATQDPDAGLSPGKWCRFCPAASTCEALAEQALDAAGADFRDEPTDIVVPGVGHNGGPAMDESELGDFFSRALAWVPVVEAWCKSVKAGSYHAAEGGLKIPGRKIVEGKEGNRRFVEDRKRVLATLRKAGLTDGDMYVEPSLKTPAQMEKVSKQAKAAVAKLTERPAGKRQLVEDADPRPAVGASLETEFEPFDEDSVD